MEAGWIPKSNGGENSRRLFVCCRTDALGEIRAGQWTRLIATAITNAMNAKMLMQLTRSGAALGNGAGMATARTESVLRIIVIIFTMSQSSQRNCGKDSGGCEGKQLPKRLSGEQPVASGSDCRAIRTGSLSAGL